MFNPLENAFPLDYLNDINIIKKYLILDDMNACRLVTLNQSILQIPYRIYNKPLTMTQINSFTHHQQLMLSCVFTRHHNGFVRHEMVKNIMKIYPILKDKDFIIPYIFLLLGEYVTEICEELYTYFESNKGVINKFIQENKELTSLTYQRCVSYWNEYYRKSKYSNFHEYPAKRIFDLFNKN
jgi:hypothetical protein